MRIGTTLETIALAHAERLRNKIIFVGRGREIIGQPPKFTVTQPETALTYESPIPYNEPTVRYNGLRL